MKFDPPSPEVLNAAVNLVVSACKDVFAESLECVTLKGSAMKGDFIRGYSDLDFHIYLKPSVMEGERVPKAEHAVRFQRAFGHIEPADFGASQFQIYFINSEKYPADWLPPVEGTFEVCWGKLPATAHEKDDVAYVQSSERFLADISDHKKQIVRRFVDKPNTQVPPIVRLLGATLKAHLHAAAIMLTKKPKETLRLRLDQLTPLVEEGIRCEGHFSTFFEHVSNWNKVMQSPEYAREAFIEGIKALDETDRWQRDLTH